MASKKKNEKPLDAASGGVPEKTAEAVAPPKARGAAKKPVAKRFVKKDKKRLPRKLKKRLKKSQSQAA